MTVSLNMLNAIQSERVSAVADGDDDYVELLNEIVEFNAPLAPVIPLHAVA